MMKIPRSLTALTTLAALTLVCALGCSREPLRADYVSARVRAHCTDPATKRECRLQVIRQYADVSLEEFQKTEQEPRTRSYWCYFQRSCIPGSPGWPTSPVATEGPKPTSQ